jgi:predicted amidohydrolase YtcJ
MRASRRVSVAVLFPLAASIGGCARPDQAPADLILLNGAVYTLRWAEPDGDGNPGFGAPFDSASGWRADAQAVVTRGDTIVYVGTSDSALTYRGSATRVVDLAGKVVVPGLADAHTHVAELGANLGRVDLVGVTNEAEAVERVVQRAKDVPKGEWILGTGWDEGAWANHYPTMALLSRRVPDHPVYLRGLHGFAAWGNRMAVDRASITRATPAPAGGTIVKDAKGEPTGIVTNSAVSLLSRAIPAATEAQTEIHLRDALEAMARAGYTSIHEASTPAVEVAALEAMAARGALPIRVHVWLDGRDTALARAWLARGPDTSDADNLVIRSVKVFADGALGSRGARLLADYSDRPGHRGITGGAYGYDSAAVAGLMRAGFQAVIHAIGDAANRETLDFFERVRGAGSTARDRIEHAQVVNAADIPRFGRLGVIASMQPSHAVEDMPWAEQRVGAARIAGGYAWRSLRRAGARLVFNSDLPATDYDIFYGLHSAVTRSGKDGRPAGGWRAHEALTNEEAVRAFTTWAAYAAFDERRGGTIEPGRRADLTVMTIDPFRTNGEELLRGAVVLTVASGKVRFSAADVR